MAILLEISRKELNVGPTNRDELISHLEKSPKVFCKHPRKDLEGILIYQHSNLPGGLIFTDEQDQTRFTPCFCAHASVKYLSTMFEITVSGTTIQYIYLEN
jgi:hypothetical protein